jgi:benzoate/toluate 1,2-dioxygenase reductase subunit
MLAGGTGLAPFLSILETIAMKGSKYPVHLIYGVTRDEDLVELSRIESLAANLPGFTWSACVADDDSVHKSKGYVTRYLEPSHLDGGNVDVYVCGPPPMVEAVRNHFTHQGIVPVGFFFEKFAPSSTGGILG